MTADVADLLLLAQLSNIAYTDSVPDQTAAVEALGCTQVCPCYETADDRALLVRSGDRTILVIRGTEVTPLTLESFKQLFDDADLLPEKLSDGTEVMAGFNAGLAELAKWTTANLPVGVVPEATGHSLGGARSHLLPAHMPVSQVTSFAAPKAAAKSYWQAFKTPLRRTVHSLDLFAAWPDLSEYCQPDDMLWLHNGTLTETTEAKWPGGWWESDHDIGAYIECLGKIAGMKAAA